MLYSAYVPADAGCGCSPDSCKSELKASHHAEVGGQSNASSSGGVPYTLATVLKPQGYPAYVQPISIILAAFGHFSASARLVTLLQGLVETAMLAGVGGNPYTLATVLKPKGPTLCNRCQYW